MITFLALFLYFVAWMIMAPLIKDGEIGAVPVFLLLNIVATGILSTTF